ncbi:C39 family peptidase [Enterococcus casseliflavus]|uniref:C39 family peptidase n=1 Tax=Enterococcus casseliflavus TaxID=37734 RepID=UPI003D0B5673
MKKKKLKRLLLGMFVLMLFFLLIFYDSKNGQSPFEKIEDELTLALSDEEQTPEPEYSEVIQLDVPLENQLAEELAYVPLYEDYYHHGDPREGFVGNIYDGDSAMGVDVEPITDVAERIVKEQSEVVSGRDKSFDEIVKVLQSGKPVWMIATLELQVPTDADFFQWNTQNGEILVTALIHSVVITGIDGETMYVNDPYGHKDREVSKEDLAAIYEKMGQQYLYLEEI